MKYVNDRVRRQDRLMDEDRAMELLRDLEYGFGRCRLWSPCKLCLGR